MRKKYFLKNIVTMLLLAIISINIIACGSIEKTISNEKIFLDMPEKYICRSICES